jgi:tetratricopeptide (TPR) repeat protein
MASARRNLPQPPLYFSQYFKIAAQRLDDYGALDLSVVSDLPLFIDPFLLFNSRKAEYRALHDEILRYLIFLRDKATTAGGLDEELIGAWYRFKEVKQNWLGYTQFGNEGQGLGAGFATALHGALGQIFADFGNETVTRSSHLEKLCLIRPGVGRDNISDFTTNLIKDWLLRYTQDFARAHLDASQCETFRVTRAAFNYNTETWETRDYYLPRVHRDFVLLTPMDMLTRDETWISYPGMLSNFERLPQAVPNPQLRAEINNYFRRQLGPDPDAKQRRAAKQATVERYRVLIDLYIRIQEDNGDQAEAISATKVADIRAALIDGVRTAVESVDRAGGFYDQALTSYDEALRRAKWFKTYVEDKDGYRVMNRKGQPFSTENEVQLFFGLVWFATDFDVNREVNNGRGPVDFKVSAGAWDKSLIEFKLASNTTLKRNLEKQIEIYRTANDTRSAVKVIVSYTARDQTRVEKILRELGIENEESIVLIDARSDNKPSASKA